MLNTKIIGYDQDGVPMYRLTKKEVIWVYLTIAVALLVMSGLVVLVMGG